VKYRITPTPPAPELLQIIFNADDLTLAELSASWPDNMPFTAAAKANAVCDRVCIRRLGSEQTLVVTGAEATVLWGELARGALPLSFTDAPPLWQTLLPSGSYPVASAPIVTANGHVV
jgi:hypothetical protein